MRVELINKEEIQNLFKSWGNFGVVCYDTNPKFAERVGKSLLESGHFSGSRGIYFTFEIEGVPRFTVDQMVRASVGVTTNVQSFRYVNMDNFEYHTPAIIEKNKDAKEIYDHCMNQIQMSYGEIIRLLNEQGLKGEKANQSARGILPMATNTKLVIGFTLEALINLANKRLCVRAEKNIRDVVKEMVKEAVQLVPELEDHLVSQCVDKLYCPEGKHCCGLYPSKQELKNLLSE